MQSRGISKKHFFCSSILNQKIFIFFSFWDSLKVTVQMHKDIPVLNSIDFGRLESSVITKSGPSNRSEKQFGAQDMRFFYFDPCETSDSLIKRIGGVKIIFVDNEEVEEFEVEVKISDHHQIVSIFKLRVRSLVKPPVIVVVDK